MLPCIYANPQTIVFALLSIHGLLDRTRFAGHLLFATTAIFLRGLLFFGHSGLLRHWQFHCSRALHPSPKWYLHQWQKSLWYAYFH